MEPNEALPDTFAEPDWALWRGMGLLHVWQAAALMSRIDPRGVLLTEVSETQSAPSRIDIFVLTLDKRPVRPPQRFSDRAWQLESHVALGPRPVDPPPYLLLASHPPSWFAALAREQGWDWPTELGRFPTAPMPDASADAASGAPPVSVVANGETFTIPHMTRDLRAMLEVMRTEWTDFDPTDAPEVLDIAIKIHALIHGAAPPKGKKPSRRLRELATATRPDHLRDADLRISAGKKPRT